MPITCLLCGEDYESLSLHVFYKHDIPISEYRRRFPDAPVVSQEVGEKISEALEGHPNWLTDSLTPESRARMGRKGESRTFTEEHKQNISKSAKKRGIWMLQTEEAKRKRRESLTGKAKSPEHIAKVAKANKRYWKKWRETHEYKRLEYGQEYQSARSRVLKRDGRKCLLCGAGDKLEVHHIDENTENNSEDNLITLCRKCHGLTHRKALRLSMRAIMRILLHENYYSWASA